MKSAKLVTALCLSFLTACASLPEGTEKSPADPFERMNRATSTFNETVDQNVFQPVARAYVFTLPSFVRTGIGNFFGNIADVWTAVNSFLQGNPEEGFNGIMRVSVNTTFGFLGLLDIASEAKIPKRRNDFGQTLGVWGIPNGPYLVLPLLGPSVMRDTAALPVNYYGDLWSYHQPVSERNIGSAVRLVDTRAALLDAYSLVEDAALDKYIFIRDAYLQRVASQIDNRRNARKFFKSHTEEDDATAQPSAEPKQANDAPSSEDH